MNWFGWLRRSPPPSPTLNEVRAVSAAARTEKGVKIREYIVRDTPGAVIDAMRQVREQAQGGSTSAYVLLQCNSASVYYPGLYMSETRQVHSGIQRNVMQHLNQQGFRTHSSSGGDSIHVYWD